MACAISRNSRLRCIFCSIYSNYWLFIRSGSTSISTPSYPQLQPFHNRTVEILRHQSRWFSPVDCQWAKYGVVPLLALNHRFHCTTTANVNKETSSDASSKANSGSATSESSGDGSQKTGEQGKPVRGSFSSMLSACCLMLNATQQNADMFIWPVSWMSFFLLLGTGAALIWYYDREKRKHIEGINSASNTVKQGPSAGKAAIGGPFSLVDHNGKPVTEKDFFGKWTLMYFGFTHCPDICPDELQKLSSAINKIKEKSGLQVVPVFISVDPERDTVEQVREYVNEFHPNLIGLTGSVDEIKKAARAYRVYYMKTEEEGSDYLVDHSIVMYLMDPKMDFVKFFGKNNDADSLADGVIKEIKQRK